MNEEKLAPNRTNSRTAHDRSSNDICHSDSLAVKETRRFEKSRNVDAPYRSSMKHSLSARVMVVDDDNPHKFSAGGSIYPVPLERRPQSRRHSAEDVIDFGAVMRLREMVIDDSYNDDDDNDALPQKSLPLSKPKNNETNSRHQGMARHLQSQRAMSMRNLNTSAMKSELLHEEQQSKNRSIKAPNLVMASQHNRRRRSVGDIHIGDIILCHDFTRGNDYNDHDVSYGDLTVQPGTCGDNVTTQQRTADPKYHYRRAQSVDRINVVSDHVPRSELGSSHQPSEQQLGKYVNVQGHTNRTMPSVAHLNSSMSWRQQQNAVDFGSIKRDQHNAMNSRRARQPQPARHIVRQQHSAARDVALSGKQQQHPEKTGHAVYDQKQGMEEATRNDNKKAMSHSPMPSRQRSMRWGSTSFPSRSRRVERKVSDKDKQKNKQDVVRKHLDDLFGIM